MAFGIEIAFIGNPSYVNCVQGQELIEIVLGGPHGGLHALLGEQYRQSRMDRPPNGERARYPPWCQSASSVFVCPPARPRAALTFQYTAAICYEGREGTHQGILPRCPARAHPVQATRAGLTGPGEFLTGAGELMFILMRPLQLHVVIEPGGAVLGGRSALTGKHLNQLTIYH